MRDFLNMKTYYNDLLDQKYKSTYKKKFLKLINY